MKNDYIYCALVFVAVGVLNNTLPGYAITGLIALGFLFAAANVENQE